MTKETPAPLHYEMTGVLQEIDYNWLHLMQTCQQAVETEREYVILPVMEEQSTKRNRVRLVKDDKRSPKGFILKSDSIALRKYYPYAAARFETSELVMYCASRFNEMTPAEIEDMLSKMSPQQDHENGAELSKSIRDALRNG